MARFIVIERSTGRVYGDTSQLDGYADVKSPVDAVILFDHKFGRAERGFGYVGSQTLVQITMFMKLLILNY